MLIELPSGKEVELRKMRLSDEDIITDTRLAKEGKNIDELIKAVTGLTQEEVDEMLMGDRTYLLIEFRRLSRGDYFYSKVTCPMCQSRYEQEIDLSKLEVQLLDREQLDENYQFDLELPSGIKLKARLLQGKDAKVIHRIRRDHPDKLMSHLMMLRTVEIEGERLKKIDFYRELDVDDTDYFRDQYDLHDCGVHTTVEGHCNSGSCMATFDLEIPFDANFFLQTKKTKKT